LCGIGIIRTREGRASYHPWTGRVHQRRVVLYDRWREELSLDEVEKIRV
jgi:hypothetical protein